MATMMTITRTDAHTDLRTEIRRYGGEVYPPDPKILTAGERRRQKRCEECAALGLLTREEDERGYVEYVAHDL